ncbi:MAG: hypothetical protein ABJN69_12855 [Hellea sp.]
MTEFTPFFEINLEHEFYGDMAPAIQFEPDASTQKLRARQDLPMHLSAGKLKCFAQKDREALKLFAEQQKQDKLEQLALRIEGLEGLPHAVPDAEQKLASLKKALNDVTAQDGRLNFTFGLRPQDSALFDVTEAVSESQNKVIVLGLTSESGALLETGALVSAADLRDLKVDSFGVDDINTQSEIIRPPLAILHLEIDAAAENCVYKVHFSSVKRHWIYHILCSDDDAMFTIKDTLGDIEFDTAGRPRRTNGTSVRSYKSNRAILARYRQPGRFELLQDGPLGPKSVMPVLPSPAMGSGVMDGSQISSEIYVNLW